MENPKFQIFEGKDEDHYFRLRAGNGEIVLKSEGYESKQGAKNGIESVRENAPDDKRYERTDSGNGQYYFNLKAANHEVIGASETYITEQAREVGIAAVKEDAPEAPVEDLTE